VEPVKAKVDRESIAMLDHLLNPVRAHRLFEIEGTPDLARYGLDSPWARMEWTTTDEKKQPRTRALRLGDEVPDGAGSRYAVIEGEPAVFSLSEMAVKVAMIEMHERRVLEFAPSSAAKLVLRRPTSEKVFRRTSKPFTGGLEWTPAPGTSLGDVDVTTLDRLVAEVSGLRAERFVQFEGPFPPEARLEAPELVIEVDLRGGQGSRRLRIGAKADAATRYATVENGADGALFLLPESPQSAWSALLPGTKEKSEPALPPNPFAPE
ncbi:MAG TPA: DUF4340 domain-containing protein, partial [Isosphaeraceae bacterium]|nr:DUF4340 domain-containing protein [Isosphaeraceae bacterium]